jgi:soluble lytic murein transglycosylase-like protein
LPRFVFSWSRFRPRKPPGGGTLGNSRPPHIAPSSILSQICGSESLTRRKRGLPDLRVAEALDVPARLALAVARFESGLRMSMHGAAGERGAMQVLPQTAHQVGIVGNLYGNAGIEAGVRYLKLAMVMHQQAGWCAVASAYNSGVWRRSHCTAYGRAVTALAALR